MMQKRNWIFRLAFVGLFISFFACKKEEIPEPDPTIGLDCEIVAGTGTPYDFPQPYFFPKAILPDYNPLTEEGIALGRKLFWDPQISKNNNISCASCHAPELAFADNVPFSVGVHNEQTSRNSMALINLAWNTSFFWDGRVSTLEEQISHPINDPIEMDMNWKSVVSRLGADESYNGMFTAAFGNECIDSVRVSYAIAQFLRTMVSANSRFDQAMYWGGLPLSPAEYRGLELFLAEGGDPSYYPGGQRGGDCFHCHGGALVQFTDHLFHNNGLDTVFTDVGREAVTGLAYDRGVFRTPTLRNIGLTAPYMHDGRFETLHDVIAHYNTGGHLSATIDPFMKFPIVGLQLTAQDFDDLVAFLHTLTDEEFVNNPAFKKPN